MIEYTKRKKCATCDSKNLSTVLDFGEVPLAGNFPKLKELDDVKIYDLSLMMCKDCGLVQTNSIISPKVLFKDYRYSSSVSLSDYFKGVTDTFDKKFNLKNSKILEIGCNDGVLLKPLKEKGADVLGVDPAENIVKYAKDKGLNVMCDFFNYDFALNHKFKDKFDIIIANNTFAHITDIQSVLKGINYSLKEDGVFIFEVHYLKNLIEMNQWDNIYHEHMYYYSVTSINNFMSKFGMLVSDFEEISNHSGSIRFFVKKIKNNKLNEKVLSQIDKEKNELYPIINNFKENTKLHIESTQKLIKELKSKGKKIIGYGSSGRANMFCNIVGLTSNDIDYIVDESPERYNRFIPKSNIPIIPKENMDFDADYVFIFAWNYSNMIMKKLEKYNFKYIVAFPHIQIVNNYLELETKTGL